MDSSPTTMDNLPDDILIEIFSYFNHQNIIAAIEVCRRWSHLILTSNSLKSRFKSTILIRKNTYLINRFYPAEINDNITFDMSALCQNIHQEIIDLLERNGRYIKTLTLKTFFMANAFEVLKMTPNLTKLILINLRRDKTGEMLELPKLKHLELVNSLKIGKFITAPSNIKTLKIMGSLSVICKRKRLETRYEEDLELKGFSAAISTFLGRCVNLKELWITGVQKPKITLDCSKFSFNLETLLLEYIVMPKANLLDFIMNQKSSLKNFSMMICEPQLELMDLILFNMNLEEIEIDTSMIPKDYEVKENISTIKRISFKSYKVQEYLRQEEYNKVHHDAVDARSESDNKMIDFNFVKNKTRVFKLRDDRDYYITPWNNRTWDHPEEGDHPLSSMLIMRILSACPELELAIFQHLYCPDFLNQLNTSCKNLKELRLYELPKEISEDLVLEDLETVEIDHMDAENDDDRKRLITFANKFPKLKSLKIHDFYDDYKTHFSEIAVGIKHLEELHLGTTYTYLDSLKDDLKKAKDNGSNLKRFSFVANFYETKYFYTITEFEVQGVQVNAHGLYRKVFTSIYHDRRIGSMRKRIGTKIAKMREICWNTLNEERTC